LVWYDPRTWGRKKPKKTYVPPKLTKSQKQKQAELWDKAKGKETEEQKKSREFSTRIVKGGSSGGAGSSGSTSSTGSEKQLMTTKEGIVEESTGDVVKPAESTKKDIGFEKLSKETKRYRSMGYPQKEAEKLAGESIKRGGFSFTPEKADELIGEEKRTGVTGMLSDKYHAVEEFVSERITKPTFDFIGDVPNRLFGVDLDVFSRGFQKAIAPTLIGIGPIGAPGFESFNVPAKEFYGGFSHDILQDVKERPIKQVGLVGAGYGIGFGSSALVSGAGAITPVAGKAAQVGLIGAGVGLGGLFAYSTGAKVMAAPSFEEKGGVMGVAAKDIMLMGVGAKAGQKGFQQATGWWRTRGRTELPLEDLTPEYVIEGKKPFPYAKTAKQEISFFKKGKYALPGEKPGAYHATGELFWKGGEFKLQPGTSELPGTYGSYGASIHFTRVSGSGSSYKLFGLTSVSGKPGIAYVTPKGFRYSPYTKTAPYQVGEQTFKYGWVKPIKPGFADIPLMKSGMEAEAIFRPGSGQYLFESGSYFTRIKGVRVPIDVFGYKGATTTTPSTGGINLLGGFSSYSIPKTPSLITSEVLGGMGLISSYIKPSSEIASPISSFTPTSKSSYKSSYKKKSPSIFSSYFGKSKKSSFTPSPLSSFSSYKPRKKSSSISSSEFGSSLFEPIKKKKKQIFGLPILGIPTKKRKGQLGKRTFYYTPSVAALGLGISAMKVPKGVVSGLVTRPIIKKKKRRSKNARWVI